MYNGKREQRNVARFWSAGDDGAVRCELCPRRCHIAENGVGACGARVNCGAELVAGAYGLVTSISIDPIEKKPLYMFHPGTHILSIGSYGCNFRCPFCQNSNISIEYADARRASRILPPDDLAALAVQTESRGNIGVAYTYNEPLINYEYVRDCAEAVRREGLKNVLVTNGCINSEPLAELLPYIDAMNIDLKAFTHDFYKKIGGSLDAVLETITASRERCHVEITTLVIPGENDDDIQEIAAWLASIDPSIPLHLSRFFPRYRYSDRTPTPRETILRLQETAQSHLKHVFAGNM